MLCPICNKKMYDEKFNFSSFEFRCLNGCSRIGYINEKVHLYDFYYKDYNIYMGSPAWINHNVTRITKNGKCLFETNKWIDFEFKTIQDFPKFIDKINKLKLFL